MKDTSRACNAVFGGNQTFGRRTAPCTHDDGRRHRGAHVNEYLGLRWMDFGMELRAPCPLPGCSDPHAQRGGAHFCPGSTAAEFWPVRSTP